MKASTTRPDALRFISPTLFSLALVYPIVTHFWGLGEQVWLSLILIYMMLCLLMLEALCSRNFILLIPLVSSLILAIVMAKNGKFLLSFYPIVITTGLFAVFARTLFPGKIPIITLFALAIEKQLSDRKTRYTRKVTLLWSMVFFGMLVESTLLAAYASYHTWSLFTNIINYIVIGAVFTLEFIFRIYHFREETSPGFLQFINQIRKLRISHVLQQKES